VVDGGAVLIRAVLLCVLCLQIIERRKEAAEAQAAEAEREEERKRVQVGTYPAGTSNMGTSKHTLMTQTLVQDKDLLLFIALTRFVFCADSRIPGSTGCVMPQ
jgi:hypothetical protein